MLNQLMLFFASLLLLSCSSTHTMTDSTKHYPPINDQTKTYFDRNELATALDDIESLLKTSPSNPHYLNALAIWLDKSQSYENAQRCYQKAMRIEAAPSTQNNLALSYALSGQFDQSIRLFKTIHVTAQHVQIEKNRDYIIHLSKRDLNTASKRWLLKEFLGIKNNTVKDHLLHRAFALSSRYCAHAPPQS